MVDGEEEVERGIAGLRDGPPGSLSLDPQPVTATAAALFLSGLPSLFSGDRGLHLLYGPTIGTAVQGHATGDADT
jgi:hypothetical protein